MRVKPAPYIDNDGIENGPMKVRIPGTTDFLPDEGAEVDDSSTYWAARVRDGDVVVVEA